MGFINNIPKILQVIIVLLVVAWMEARQHYSYYPHQHPYHTHQHAYQPHEHEQLLQINPHYQQLQPMQEIDMEYRDINTRQAIEPSLNPEDLPHSFDFFNFNNITFPGTKWCGPGNTASNKNDLGFFEDVDKCCRDHDHCDHLLPQESIGNVTNHDKFSLMKCSCDINFLRCLKVADFPGYIIGKCYFNNEKRKPFCYTYDYPTRRCLYAHELTDIFGIHKRCELYDYYFKRGPKRHILKDLPLFIDDEDERSAIDEEEIFEKNNL